MMTKEFGPLINKASKLIRHFFPSQQELRVRPWFKDNGDYTLRLNYPELDQNSIVVDLGGYEGQWASDLFSRYRSKVLVFEPVWQFYNFIKQRFSKNDKISVFHYALSDKDEESTIYVNGDKSSAIKQNGAGELIKFKKFDIAMAELGIEKINLLKINIEGGEYDLLEYLIKNKWVEKIENIQVQFHDFAPNALSRMKNIQTSLRHTHMPTYQYEFVWENWKLKPH